MLEHFKQHKKILFSFSCSLFSFLSVCTCLDALCCNGRQHPYLGAPWDASIQCVCVCVWCHLTNSEKKAKKFKLKNLLFWMLLSPSSPFFPLLTFNSPPLVWKFHSIDSNYPHRLRLTNNISTCIPTTRKTFPYLCSADQSSTHSLFHSVSFRFFSTATNNVAIGAS